MSELSLRRQDGSHVGHDELEGEQVNTNRSQQRCDRTVSVSKVLCSAGYMPRYHLLQTSARLHRLFSSAAPAAGFAGIPGLLHPTDWHTLAKDAVTKCEPLHALHLGSPCNR
jgi:hypothetical protein